MDTQNTQTSDFLLVNGKRIPLAEEDRKLSLLRWLREKQGLTGTKCGCYVGQCGSCNVIADGKLVRSCLFTCEKMIGKNIRTIEGLEVDGKLHPVQESFLACGVMQCGYCTPAQVMAVVCLLENNPSPTREEINKTFKGVLCRCGSYGQVLKAIDRAAAIMRGEEWTDPEPEKTDDPIGVSHNMPDAREKITGKKLFCADVYHENELWGKIVFAKYAHAKLIDVDVEGGLKLPGVKWVECFKTVPPSIIGSLEPDMPIIASGKVRHLGEIVAIVWAETREEAEAAAEQLNVTYEELPAVFDPYAADEEGAVIVHEEFPDNIAHKTVIQRGDAVAALANADVVVEGTYGTQRIEHNYIETECFSALPYDDGRIEIWVEGQSYYHERNTTAKICGLREDQVICHQMPLGGSFGGKECYPTPALVGYAAKMTGRPVRLELDRKDSYRYSTKRHPWTNHIRLGADKNGKLVGMYNRIITDGGAYKSFSPRVLPQGVSHSTGPYVVPNLDVIGKAMYTNNLTSGAMRGYGSPQAEMGAECMMDELATALKMDPIEIRRINGVKPGAECCSGAIMREGQAYLKTLDYIEKKYREEFLPMKKEDPTIGIGIASGWRHVTGGCGAIEEVDTEIELLGNGKIRLNVGQAQMGNETLCGLAQILAKCLEVPYEMIDINTDIRSDITPWGGAVMASRGLMLWGIGIIETSKVFLEKLNREAKRCIAVNAEYKKGRLVNLQNGYLIATLADLKRAYGSERFFVREHASLPRTYYPLPDGNRSGIMTKEDYHVHLTYSYVSAVVALKTDVEAGTAQVKKIYAAFDVGTVVNPASTRRQAIGGLFMGMGMGLQEEFKVSPLDGSILTTSMPGYKVPTMSDMPEIEVDFVDNYDPAGPFGAKGIGELGLLPCQPAILNAWFNATGKRVHKLPLLNHLKDADEKADESAVVIFPGKRRRA